MSATIVEDEITLSAENIAWIREALIIGLICYGEIEKVLSAKELRESMGVEWPNYLDVRHPTGDCDVVSKFATALMITDVA
jgi:hypothetical protein